MRLISCLILSITSVMAMESPAVGKVLALFQELNAAQATGRKVKFELTQAEVNEYLRHAAKVNPRPGLESTSVKFFPANYISTFTVVDFDLVERIRPGTIPAILRPALQGKKAIWVDIRLNATGGMATFSVEKAYFDNIRLPAFVVEKLINVIGARQKEAYDTARPVPLPFRLRIVSTGAQMMLGEN